MRAIIKNLKQQIMMKQKEKLRAFMCFGSVVVSGSGTDLPFDLDS